jgi:hypothetical protein
MLDRDEELKLLAFLASLAGLLGIVVSVSNFQIGSASSTTVRAYFSNPSRLHVHSHNA